MKYEQKQKKGGTVEHQTQFEPTPSTNKFFLKIQKYSERAEPLENTRKAPIPAILPNKRERGEKNKNTPHTKCRKKATARFPNSQTFAWPKAL